MARDCNVGKKKPKTAKTKTRRDEDPKTKSSAENTIPENPRQRLLLLLAAPLENGRQVIVTGVDVSSRGIIWRS